MFYHLTTHSAFSLLEGLLLPAELAQAAKEQGMTALGLTDHRLLSGSIEFAAACRQADVQSILGLEVDLPGGVLSLLATSLEGWANLCSLSSFLALQEDPNAACSIESLAPLSRDLIALCDMSDEPAGHPLSSSRSSSPTGCMSPCGSR